MRHAHWVLFGLVGLFVLPVRGKSPAEPPKDAPKPGNAVTAALWFAHAYGSPEALVPGKDRALKVKLISVLGKSPELTLEGASDFLDRDQFRALAGGDKLGVAAMEKFVEGKVPAARRDMHPKVRAHLDLLTTQFDQIEEAHRTPNAELVEWVVKNHKPGRPLGVVVMCTGNTRRSVLGAQMGNLAASYYGLTDVRFHSGGTDPDAVNPRTVATLREIGVEVEPTGQQAPRGKAGVANPIYKVCWGKGQEALEFSKVYTDAANPKDGFAALLVCSEVDTACPKVPGAGARIPLPYLDPKAFDGAPFEAAKYAERRDDIGRFMLSVCVQARRRL
ncbi:MAG: hypothetical protein K2V38_18285, partial [Gemmataceae bacterium]|nr:hypothetical protein [Gemmataceae bacterium]